MEFNPAKDGGTAREAAGRISRVQGVERDPVKRLSGQVAREGLF